MNNFPLKRLQEAVEAMIADGNLNQANWARVDMILTRHLMAAAANYLTRMPDKTKPDPLKPKEPRERKPRKRIRPRIRLHTGKEKEQARTILREAVKAGRIFKPSSCSLCGHLPTNKAEIHGHHSDYSRPLAVQWLCRECHGQAHSVMAHSSGRMVVLSKEPTP